MTDNFEEITPSLPEVSLSRLGKAAYAVGGTGLLLWGTGMFFFMLSILIETLASYSLAARLNGVPVTFSSTSMFNLSLLVFLLYFVCTIMLMIVGVSFVQRKFSRKLIVATISLAALSILALMNLIPNGIFSFTELVYVSYSSIFAVVAACLYLIRSRLIKMAGGILGIVSVSLLGYVFLQGYSAAPLFGVLTESDLSLIKLTFSPAFSVIMIAIIFGTILLVPLGLISERASRRKTTVFIFVLISSTIFGLGLFDVGLRIWQAQGVVSNLFVDVFQGTFILNSIVPNFDFPLTFASILTIASGLLILVGSTIGIGSLVRSFNAPISRHRPSVLVSAGNSSTTPIERNDELSAPAQLLSSDNQFRNAKRSLYCPFCGNELSGDEAFCGHCGRKIQSLNFRRRPQGR